MTKSVSVIVLLTLGLAGCAAVPPDGTGPTFSGPGAPGEGMNCGYANPGAVAPHTPCPTG